MGREVTFDYSKTSGFISTEELQNIKGAVMGAKEVLLSKTGEREVNWRTVIVWQPFGR